jgi:hypothetical protein
MFDNHLINPFSIGATIIYYLSIPFQRDWQRNALIRACNNGFGFGTLSLRHVGWLVVEFSAYHASFFPKPQIPLEPGIFQTSVGAQVHSHHLAAF